MKDILKAVVWGGLFAIPFLTLYVENDYFFPFITGKNFWFRIIVDVTVAAWVVLFMLEARYRPRISAITWSFGALLVVMFFANLFGLHPSSSFWSNFERMDGYVSLVHTFLYMLVLGSVLQTKQHWQYLLNTSLAVASLVALYGLMQYFGYVDGSNRIDSRLGNAAYMAVYMLFHIFIAFWLFVETKKAPLKVTYAALAIMFTFVLVETGTRGTAIGLAVGVTVMAGYIGLFATGFKEYRKYAIGAFVLLLLAAGAFIGFRDSALIQSNPNLARIANISLEDLTTRATIWGMAWEGVQERPFLGYGQSNFNYVFNEYYEPSLYDQEQWFDRAHNIFFDWLIAGGFLGLFAYLSIFVAAVWYLFFRPLFQADDEAFTPLERGILLGILAGYFTHNFVVFDNIVSYIFFAIILGLITARVGSVPRWLRELKVEPAVVLQVVAPVMLALVIAVVWFVHRPGMLAASDIIDGFRAQSPEARLEAFERALERDTFARQEITEQLVQQAISFARNQQVPEETRQRFLAMADQEIQNLIDFKPGDARIHVFAGSFYRTINDLEAAQAQMARARELSPEKPAIIIQQGLVELSLGNMEAGREYMREAFELEPENIEARQFYAASLFYTGSSSAAIALAENERILDRFAESDFLLSAANEAGATEFVGTLFDYRIEDDPDNPQDWASKAFIFYQAGSSSEAVAVLEEAAVAIPSFASTAECFANNIRNGQDPQTGCQ